MRILQIMAGLLTGNDPKEINKNIKELGIPNQPVTQSSLDNIVDLVGLIAGITAVIVVVVAGINYSLSAGDPQKTAKAKNTIIYAVTALVIISIAFAITKFIIGRV